MHVSDIIKSDDYGRVIPLCGCRVNHVMPNGSTETFDACLLFELTKLWELGIETCCHCCGHKGERGYEPYIAVDDEGSANGMRDLGYEEIEDKKGCGACAIAFFKPKSKLMCMED